MLVFHRQTVSEKNDIFQFVSILPNYRQDRNGALLLFKQRLSRWHRGDHFTFFHCILMRVKVLKSAYRQGPLNKNVNKAIYGR